MSGINSWHHYLPTYQILKISDNVQFLRYWFPTLNNYYWSLFSKWPPQYCKNSTLSDIIKIWYVGRKWCPELNPDIEKFLMLSFCDIVVAILKMATVRKFSMSGINSWHHYLPTYQILKISDNVQFLRYCGGHAIFKMATTIPHKFNIARFQRNFTCG
jgi:hypothetical protein